MATMLLLLFHRRSRPFTITSSPSTHGQSGSRTPRHATCRFSEWTSRVLHGCFLRRSCALALPIAGFASRDVQPSHGLLSWPRASRRRCTHSLLEAINHFGSSHFGSRFWRKWIFSFFFFFSCLCCHDGPQCPVVGIRCPTEVARVWESNGRSTSAIQKTSKVQGRVQCLEAAVWQLLGRCSEDRDRGRIATSQGREAGGSIAPAHPLDFRRCPGAGTSQGHQARTSPSSHGRFAVCRGRHVAGSVKASSPISARTSSCQSNFRVHTFHRAVNTSPQKDRDRTGGGGGSSRRGTLPIEAQSKMCPPDVPMSTATKTGSDVIAELEELKAKLASTEQERGRQLANGKRCRRPIESVVKFQDNARIVNVRHGQRGVRVGEASHPGPTRRRRTQRLRALPWVWGQRFGVRRR